MYDKSLQVIMNEDPEESWHVDNTFASTILKYAINALRSLRRHNPEALITIDMKRELLVGLFDCGHEIDESVFNPKSSMLDTQPAVFTIQRSIQTLPAHQLLGGK